MSLFKDIPSTGFEEWIDLEGRSSRSNVEGRIRLKLNLATREDKGYSEEDNWLDILEHENLICIFIEYELRKFKVNLIYINYSSNTSSGKSLGEWESLPACSLVNLSLIVDCNDLSLRCDVSRSTAYKCFLLLHSLLSQRRLFVECLQCDALLLS